MSSERIAKLESIGFDWDKQEANWNRAFDLVAEYYEKHGTLPEVKVVVDGLQIGKWYSQQIVKISKGKVSRERLERFKNAGIPTMSIRDMHRMETWMKYYNSYMEYLNKYDRQPGSTERYNDLELRKWRNLQLQKMKQGKLSEEQTAKLRELCDDVAWNE